MWGRSKFTLLLVVAGSVRNHGCTWASPWRPCCTHVNLSTTSTAWAPHRLISILSTPPLKIAVRRQQSSMHYWYAWCQWCMCLGTGANFLPIPDPKSIKLLSFKCSIVVIIFHTTISCCDSVQCSSVLCAPPPSSSSHSTVLLCFTVPLLWDFQQSGGGFITGILVRGRSDGTDL